MLSPELRYERIVFRYFTLHYFFLCRNLNYVTGFVVSGRTRHCSVGYAHLTCKIDSYAPIEEYKLMFRKLFVSFKKFTLSAESLVNIFRISLTKQMTLIVSGTR